MLTMAILNLASCKKYIGNCLLNPGLTEMTRIKKDWIDNVKWNEGLNNEKMQ